jgi:hypothetical protein
MARRDDQVGRSLPPGWKLPEQAKPGEATEKPLEEMSTEELSEAIEEAKRELLKAQRQELQTREETQPSRRSFSEFIKARPYWR